MSHHFTKSSMEYWHNKRTNNTSDDKHANNDCQHAERLLSENAEWYNLFSSNNIFLIEPGRSYN